MPIWTHANPKTRVSNLPSDLRLPHDTIASNDRKQSLRFPASWITVSRQLITSARAGKGLKLVLGKSPPSSTYLITVCSR